MTDSAHLDKVAERMAQAFHEAYTAGYWAPTWYELSDSQREKRIAAQRAALDAVFAEDRRRINPQTRPKPCENCGHLKGVHSIPCPILNLDHTECGCMEYRYTPPKTSWESRLVDDWQAYEDTCEEQERKGGNENPLCEA